MVRWMFAALSVLTSFLSPLAFAASGSAAEAKPNQVPATPFFRITIVDEETGRGIPLVKLRTTNNVEYWTDSAGVVAFWEPQMMGAKVNMSIETYGYSTTQRNIFGGQEVSFVPKAGESIVFKMQRDMIGQRLYRLTGADIYRDSEMLGDKVPPTQDPSPQPVVGMDSVVTAVYGGKMHWIWGDTGISSTNLGNFRSTGAVSDLPGKGGLDPEVGISYTFFRNPDGRVRGMINTDHNVIWMGGMHVVRDKSGKERMFASYTKVKPPMVGFESGLLEFNDETEKYDLVWAYPEDANLRIGGCPFRYTEDGVAYFYHSRPFPSIRSRADVESIKDIYSYEGLTCLKEGSKFNGSEDQLVRDKKGHLVWGWRRNTSVVGVSEMKQLIEKGIATAADGPSALTDADTGESVLPHSGSVYWNDYRKRWIACTLQFMGASPVGEVWIFEGDTPLGPWVYGQKVVTHAIFRKVKEGARRIDEAKPQASEVYSFYNVNQHPEFDKDGGRVIYFEGTYTEGFSGNKHPTPRYNYNQMMYKVELDDARLRLPVAIYRVDGKNAGYYQRNNLPENVKLEREGDIAFFAPEQERKGTVAVYQVSDKESKSVRLTLEKPAGEEKPAVAFYAEPDDVQGETSGTLRATVPLYEYKNSKTGERFYSVKESLSETDKGIDALPEDADKYARTEKPLCRVWPNPIRFNPYRLKS